MSLRAPLAVRYATRSTVAGLALLVVIGALVVVPIGVIVLGSVKAGRPIDPFSFTLEGWEMLLQSPKTLRSVVNSFFLVLRVPLALVVGLAMAWLLVRVRIPGHALIELGFWVAFFLPILPVTLGWVLVLDPNYGLLNEALEHLPFVTGPVFNIYSLLGIFWVHFTATTVPIMTVILAPVLRQFDSSLEESSRVCGSGPVRTARDITIPLIAPALLTALLAGLIRGMEAFEVERVLGVPSGIDVYSTRIYDLIRTEPAVWPGAMALGTLFLILLLALALLYQRYTARHTFATMGGRGTSFRPMVAGRWRYLASGACFLFLAVSLFVPLITLLTGSFMRLYGIFTIESPFTAEHWRTVLTDKLFASALTNTVALGLGVAILGLTVYSLVAYAIVRTRMPGRQLLSLLAWLPWGVPGILLGVGMLTLLLSSPLAIMYGTVGALVLALFVKEMPFATHMTKTAFGQVSAELEQAARTCGAGWFRAYRTIMLPLVSPTLVMLFVLVFLGTIRDIGTVVLLADPRSRPLSVLLLEFTLNGNLEEASVIGVIIAALAIIVAVGARRMGLRVEARSA